MEFTKVSYEKRAAGYYDVYIFYSKDGDRLRHKTGIKVDFKHLTKKKEISSSHPNYFADTQKIKEEKNKVERVVAEYYKKYEEKPPVKYVQEQVEKPVLEIREIRDSDLLNYMESFVVYKKSMTKEGSRSVNVYGSLLQALDQYSTDKNKKLSFEIINQDFINSFAHYLLYEKKDITKVKIEHQKTGMNNNSTSLRLKTLLEFLRWCKLANDINLDTEKIKFWINTTKKVKSIKGYEPEKEILLPEEIEMLGKWKDCPEEWIRYKKVFYFSCKNGMRISDNNSLKKYHAIGEQIKKSTVKTGTKFKINLDDESLKILKDLNYDLSVSVNYYNRELKKMLKLFLETVYAPYYKKKTGKEYEMYVYKIERKGKDEIATRMHKSERFASHNARVIKITTDAIAGKPLHKIMGNVGHTDMRTTLRYIHEHGIDYDLAD